MASRTGTGQRTFRLTEDRAKVWEAMLAEAGMKQQSAMDTIVDALGERLISLNDLRSAVIRIRLEKESATE
ncbi:hypothetical protein [Nocardia carnea]|uniref:hypothetical protein n=1 Tax=Nocardia carnea TaxID=37328 RepID=UPI0024586593|nr:hypothetical protein [Nocardia carnea]